VQDNPFVVPDIGVFRIQPYRFIESRDRFIEQVHIIEQDAFIQPCFPDVRFRFDGFFIVFESVFIFPEDNEGVTSVRKGFGKTGSIFMASL